MIKNSILAETLFWMFSFLVISYIASRISIDYYNFIHVNFIRVCRSMNLPIEVWAFMDNHIFYGAL
jgi:hypothetical protein